MATPDDAVRITQDLVKMDTINPPGNEEQAARYLGELLAGAGLEVSYHQLDQDRAGVVATLPGSGDKAPLVFTGHLDTVPLGNAPWDFAAHSGEISDGHLLGRGSSDMKSGVAASAAAAMILAQESSRASDLLFVYTAAEETGSQGAEQMVASGELPTRAGALLVAEPTSNRPFLGHKGALWLECTAEGKSAHGSMPDMGVNAIYKAARAAAGLEDFFAGAQPHPQLGPPTINVGTFNGGSKINMVPDCAKFQVDLRTVPPMDHAELAAQVTESLGPEISVRQLIDLPGTNLEADNAWAQQVLSILAEMGPGAPEVGYVNYFTDASVLKPGMGNPPTIILGPGEPGMAHQTNEYCSAAAISQAAEYYVAIGRAWVAQ